MDPFLYVVASAFPGRAGIPYYPEGPPSFSTGFFEKQIFAHARLTPPFDRCPIGEGRRKGLDPSDRSPISFGAEPGIKKIGPS